MTSFTRVGVLTAILTAVLAVPATLLSQSNSIYTNVLFPAQSLTATAQTTPALNLAQPVPGGAHGGGSFTVGTVTVTGTALTTVTFAVQGSFDGGNTYFPLNISLLATPGTTALTQTATASGVYQFHLTGVTNVQIVTSGTFTATSVKFAVSASPNGNLTASFDQWIYVSPNLPTPAYFSTTAPFRLEDSLAFLTYESRN